MWAAFEDDEDIEDFVADEDIGKGEPLPLIEFKEKGRNRETEAHLNSANLDLVLSKTRGKPLSIISACGPSKQGKSFLLNYTIRSLNSLQDEEPDWMGYSDEEAPLTGFAFQTGKGPVTNGIWIWSQPLFIEKDEEQIAVILLDTQGTFDESSSEKEMSTIIGLSMLLSSTIIYNFIGDIPEEVFSYMNTYTEYASLVLKEFRNCVPFQKLIFLIRDWQKMDDFPLGEKGGKNFLQGKLQGSDDHSREAKAVRKSINKSFSSLSCFLLPHIGKNGITSTFTGSVSELSKDFATNLEQFISNLTSPEELIIKEFLGNQVKAPQFKILVEEYTKLLGKPGVPTSAKIWEVSSQISNVQVMEMAKETFREFVEQMHENKRYLSESDLRAAIHSGANQSMRNFRQDKKFGSKQAIQALEKQFKADVEKEGDEITEKNRVARDNVIKEVARDVEEIFRKEIENKLSLENQSDTLFYPDGSYERLGQEAKSWIYKTVKTELKDEKDEDFNKILEGIDATFQNILSNYISRNANNKSNAEEQLISIVKTLFNEYYNSISRHFDDNKFTSDDSKHMAYHKTTANDVVKTFQTRIKPGDSTFQQHFELDLHSKMEEAFANQLKNHNLHIQSVTREMQEFALNLASEYGKELKKTMKEIDSMNFEMLKVSLLQARHEQRIIQVIGHFNQNNQFPNGSSKWKESENLMKDHLEKSHKGVETLMVKNFHQREEDLKNILDQSFHGYTEEMEGFSWFQSENELKRKHEIELSKAIQNFENSPIAVVASNATEAKLQLKNNIERSFAEVREQNRKKRQLAEGNIRDKFPSYLAHYERLMQDAMTKKLTIEELRANHQTSTKLAVQSLRDDCPASDEDFLNSFKNQLIAKIEAKFREMMGKYEVKCWEDDMRKAEENSFNAYKQQMMLSVTQSDFLHEEELQDKHNQIHQVVLQNFLDNPSATKASNVAELKLRLQENMKRELKKIQTENKKERSKAQEKMEANVSKCVGMYNSRMSSHSNDATETSELLEAHTTEKLKALQALKETNTFKNVSFRIFFEKELGARLEDEFKKLKKVFDSELSKEKVEMKEILYLCRDNYNRDMEQHCRNDFFIKPEEVKAFHGSTKEIVIQIVKTEHTLSDKQLYEMNKYMDSLLERFVIQNDMKLSGDGGSNLAPAIGIDLGTTYCCVGVFYKGKVVIIQNEESGEQTTPSYVSFEANGRTTVGRAAKDNAFQNPEDTIFDAKRIIGRTMTDPELLEDMKFWPFTVKPEMGVPKILAQGALYHPEEVSAKLLEHFRIMAEKQLKLAPGTIKKAVITVPAYFNDGQRQATMDAGKLAKLDVLTILNEPTAAAIAYCLQRYDSTPKNIVVYDLGGGTFDVAVLKMQGKNIEVLGVDGDVHLGGEDFDKKLMEHCAAKFQEMTGINLLEDIPNVGVKSFIDMRFQKRKTIGLNQMTEQGRQEAKRRLRRLQTQCEIAKKTLTTAKITRISVDGIYQGLDLSVEVTREQFNAMNCILFRKSIELLDKTLTAVKLKKSDIEEVVLVGGSSRIPKVQEMLTEYFGGKALNKEIHPDYAVGYGAAVQAALMNGLQARGHFDFGTIQDVTPFSLGIELYSKDLSVIIPKNSKIPIKKQSDYYTTTNNQKNVRIKIYEGENETYAAQNKLLGEFVLDGIPPARAGKEPIDVSMEINAMGILHVEATCRSTKGKTGLTVTENKQRLTKEAIKKLLGE